MSKRYFKRGDELAAVDLQGLVERVRRLQGRVGGADKSTRKVRHPRPARYAAFDVVEYLGVLYYRQGAVELGGGVIERVGEAEWNELCCVEPCTIWLEVSVEGCVVVLGEYDEVTASTPLRCRLAYVRDAGDGALSCVQLRRGLQCPLAPRRMLGTPFVDMPAAFAAGDASMHFNHAGFVVGAANVDGEQEELRVALGWSCSQDVFELPGDVGGSSRVLDMSFSCRV